MYFWDLISSMMVTCIRIAWFISRLFIANSFIFNSLVEDIRTRIPILTVVQNARISRQKKNSHILRKKFVFKAFSWRWKSILTIYCEYFTFQFLKRGIRVHMYIITLIQKGHISGTSQSYFPTWRSTACRLVVLYFHILLWIPSFSVL